MPVAALKPTSEAYQVIPGQTETRQHIFSALVKRTYAIRPDGLVRLEKPRPFHLIDSYFKPGDPETCSIRTETDLVPFKLATDVVLIGSVHAPKGTAVPVLDAGIDVAGHRKILRVIGNRQCLFRERAAPAFTEPEEFRVLELRYERAYGGTDAHSIKDMPFSYPRNHLGRGFVLSNRPDLIHGLPLPNFEDPSDLLTPERVIVGEPERWPFQPLPQGFGWFQRTWYPRCSFVASVPAFLEPDTPLKEAQLGLVPANQVALARQFKLPSFDARFNSGASPGLSVPFLRGGERVRLLHLTPEGQSEFIVPSDVPQVRMDIGFGDRFPEAFLQTLCIRTGDGEVDLIWRVAHEYPGIDWLPEMKKLDVEVLAS